MDEKPKGPSHWRILRSLWRANRSQPPRPAGSGTFDHESLAPILDLVARSGIAGAASLREELAAYRRSLVIIDPGQLNRDEALAFWINLYNAEVLAAAVDARENGLDSLLRIPDAFDRRRCTIAGEVLSLDDIEHGKIRRFGDPRVHAALVCGSVSCPSLPAEPMRGADVQDQLDAATTSFLAEGGAVADLDAGELRLSRIFLWYGADFVYPKTMPRWRPVIRRSIALSLRRWMPDEEVRWLENERPRIHFLPYDWTLACRVGQPPVSSTLSAGIDTRISPRKSPTA
jgi:hypothetical protein